jgi:uncharacterized protein (TIGR02300 family)
VAKPELGTKRLCPNCGTKYYDLDRNPILCPKCGTAFTLSATAQRMKAAPVEEEEEDLETEEATAPVDFVSLEEVAIEEDAEAVPETDDEEIPDIGGDDGDDTFLEEDEDDGDIDIDIDVAGEDEER